jgi:hypothetical protein
MMRASQLAKGVNVGRFGAWTVVGLCVFVAGACAGTTTDGAAGSGGSPADGSGGRPAGSGGAILPTGGTGGTSQGTGGSPGGNGGLGGAGGAGDVCSLPFEVGDCDAAIPVYFHNPMTERCEPRVYGGCGGNENRFESFTECEVACDVVSTAPACEVSGITYPDGWSPVPDPTSCNSCSCSAGQLDGCSEADCPEPCPGDTVRATDCAACAPNDACEVVRTDCLPACDNQEDCAASGGFCSDGACRQLCG